MTSETFPQHLERLRRAHRVSLNALATRTGLNIAALSRHQSGQSNPRRSSVLKIAEALSLDPIERDLLLMSAEYVPDALLALTAKQRSQLLAWLADPSSRRQAS